MGRELTPGQLTGSEPLPELLPVGRRLETRFLRQTRRLPPDTQTLLLTAAADPTGDPALLWRARRRPRVGAGGRPPPPPRGPARGRDPPRPRCRAGSRRTGPGRRPGRRRNRHPVPAPADPLGHLLQRRPDRAQADTPGPRGSDRPRPRSGPARLAPLGSDG